MDHKLKRNLVNSISYLQANLNVNRDLLSMLQSRGVFTAEEISTVEKADIGSDRVLELVYRLKSKGSRVFSRFLNVMSELNLENVVEILNGQDTAQPTDGDPRTISIIELVLGDTPQKKRFAYALSSYVILKNVHQDEVAQLQDEVERFRQYVPITKNGRLMSQPSYSRSNSSCSNASSEEETAVKQVNFESRSPMVLAYQEQIKSMTRMLEKAQADVDAANKDAETHLNYINHLTERIRSEGGRPSSTETQRLPEERVEDLSNTNKELVDRISQMRAELTYKDSKLNEAEVRLKKIKEVLGIDPNDPDADIDAAIEAYVRFNKKKTDFEKLKADLTKAKQERDRAMTDVDLLRSKMNTLQFEIRQNENTIKRISRRKRTDVLIPPDARGNSLPLRTQTLDLSDFEYLDKGIMADIKFCILCKTEFVTTRSTTCSTHTKPLRRGMWSCCKHPSYKGVTGCRTVPHLYIERLSGKGVHITNGVSEIPLGD